MTGASRPVAAHRIDQIEDEQRIAPLQRVKMVEVEFDGDDLGDEAELGERRGNGLGADQRIDLVWTVFRRGMHDGDEAAPASAPSGASPRPLRAWPRESVTREPASRIMPISST